MSPEEVKLALRIKSSAYDAEIISLIAAAQATMAASGVSAEHEGDPMYIAAITAYCKAHFGMENENADRWNEIFNGIVQHMALCGTYNDRGE